MMPNEDRLADLLVQWEQRCEQGQDVSAQELCRNCPELAEELDRRITALKATAWLDKPIPAATAIQEGSPQPSSTQPRTLAGRYRLDQLLAEGGFGEVWKGFDLELQRTVAIKMPKASRLGSVEAFIAEARKVARLKHPGIVPIFDVGKEDNTCFLVSELVEGGSLADRIAKNRPTANESARIIAEVAETLHYAHQQGFVHRDIKPGNILLDHHGRALLTDFGIAVTPDDLPGSSFGTLAYMAPEQVEVKPTDCRSDIYSLGVVLHELLTGRLPFEATEPTKLRREIVSGPKGVFCKADQVAGEIRRICEKCLARDAVKRYATAGELATDLRRFLATGGRSSARRKVIGVAVLALLLVGVGLVIWLQNRGSPITNLTQKPATVEEALALGRSKFDKNYFEAADEAYTEAIRLDPDCAEAYRRRGACRFNQSKFKESLPDFTKALELDPKDAETYKNRALAYSSLWQLDPAIADVEAALKLKPDDPAPYNDLLARIYSNRAAEKARNKKFAEAAADVTEAMRYAPKAAIFHHQRGSCYFNLKEYEKAADDFTQAIETEPTKASHYLHRGYCLQAMGKEKEARADFEKAKSLGDK